MKITSTEIRPSGSTDVIVLSFRDARRLNPFNVKGITGLDADEIVPRYYASTFTHDKKFYNLSLEKREISISIELNPEYSSGESTSDLRDRLYKCIASSRTGLIEIQFKNGTEVVAVLSGFVSKLENALFEKQPGATLTIECKEPLLKAPSRTEFDILTLDLASSNIQDGQSTAPHGFIFELGFLNPLATLAISPPDDSWSFVVSPSGGFLVGDILHFSSELNNKYLFVRRDSGFGDYDFYLADAIVSGSIWPIIFPGDNIFEFANPTDMVWGSVAFYPTYWGV